MHEEAHGLRLCHVQCDVQDVCYSNACKLIAYELELYKPQQLQMALNGAKCQNYKVQVQTTEGATAARPQDWPVHGAFFTFPLP
jgi:hypothetical protein